MQWPDSRAADASVSVLLGEWFHANAQARVRVAVYSYIGADGP